MYNRHRFQDPKGKVAQQERVREYQRTHPELTKLADDRNHKARTIRKKQVFETLGGKCSVCGFIPKHIGQIDFHEINGSISKHDSEFKKRPSEMFSAKRLPTVLKHIDELAPLCRNCHILAHTNEFRAKTAERIAVWRASRVRHSDNDSEQSEPGQKNT